MTDQKFEEKKPVLSETLNDVQHKDENTLVERDEIPSDGSGRAPLTGSVLDGKYEVGELIGRGGMSVVYRARHLLLNKPVAIKFLHPHLTHDENAFRRFQKEAKAVTSLTHDGIIHVYDFGQLPDGQPYLAMELLDGQTLADFISKSGALNRQNALTLFKTIATALVYAHDKGVIHRDLKPSNVVLDKSGDFERAKVVDFGIAKFEDEASVKLTATGEIFGSPPYMSPEQCRGETLDKRSDVYSMGCLMYEALTGQPPFTGSTSFQIMHMQIGDSPQPFSEIRPGLKDCFDLEAVVLKCLAKDPANRFQSARDLSINLEELQHSSERKFGKGLSSALRLQKAREGTKGKSGGLPGVAWAAILVSIFLSIVAVASILLVPPDRHTGRSEPANKVALPNGSWMDEHRKGILLMNEGNFKEAANQFASSAKLARARPELVRSLVVNLSNQALCAHILQDRGAEKKYHQQILNVCSELKDSHWGDNSAVESLKLLWSSKSLQGSSSNPDEIRQLLDRSRPLLERLNEVSRGDEALPIIEMLLAKCEKTLSSYDPLLADVLFLKARALMQVAEFDLKEEQGYQKVISTAAELLERSVSIREKYDRKELPKTLSYLARAQFQGASTLGEAEQTVSRALSMFDSSPSHEKGYALFMAGRIHGAMNDSGHALEEYRAARSIFAEEHHLVMVERCVRSEAGLIARVHGAKEAQGFLDTLIKRQSEEGNAMAPLTGVYYSALGDMLFDEQMYEPAKASYQSALEIDQTTNHIRDRRRKTLDHLIRCLIWAQESLRALGLTQQMTAIDERLLPESQRRLEEDYSRLAWIYASLGRNEEAQRILKSRLARINTCPPEKIQIDEWLIDLAKRKQLSREQSEMLLGRAQAYLTSARLRHVSTNVIAEVLLGVAQLEDSLGMKKESLETFGQVASEARQIRAESKKSRESLLKDLVDALISCGRAGEAQAIEKEIAQLRKGL